MGMKNGIRCGILCVFLAIGSVAFGMFSENSRQGSEPIFSITDQGIELLNPAPDLESEGNGAKNRGRVNNLGKQLTPYLFASRRLDGFSGQYWNRNRYYQPKYGRFLSKDFIGFSGNNNLWNYVKNNPLGFVDPLGLSEIIVTMRNDSTYNGLAQELRLYGPMFAADTEIIDTSGLDAKHLLKKLAEKSATEGIFRLFLLGHGSPGEFYVNWTYANYLAELINAPIIFPKSAITSTSLQGFDNILKANFCDFKIRPQFSFIYSCYSGYGENSFAQAWANYTKSPTYGSTGPTTNALGMPLAFTDPGYFVGGGISTALLYRFGPALLSRASLPLYALYYLYQTERIIPFYRGVWQFFRKSPRSKLFNPR